MQYVHLGRTGLRVSRLCLGTMNFGPLTSEGDSFALMDRAREAGINFFDTANVYGWRRGEGVTEQIIGRWLAQGGGRRESIVLATKVYATMGEGPPACRAHGVGVIPWSPLAGGLLGGALQKAKEGRRASERLQKSVERYRAQLETYEGLCRELGESPADVALAWLLANPAVTAPIIGPRTMEQLTGSLRALEITLSAEQLARLDRIWPGPGGEAPEAYAW